MQTQMPNTLHNAIMEACSKDRPPMLAPVKEIPISEGSHVTRTESQMETYKTVSQGIRDQLNAEGEAVQIILTGIDNDIYSTVDACPNACEMWKAIERIGNVARARETVGSTVVQKYRIQCYNCKEFGHVAKECQKPKRVKDAAYHREKMLLCKQEEAVIQLNAEQADCRDDNDDELEDQELKAHYMYMAKLQEVSPDAADSGPIFDAEPLQKVSNDDHYNVFAIKSEHPEHSESVHDTYPTEQGAHNVIIDSLDMSYDREEIDQNDDDADLVHECQLLASLIEKLKCEIDESKTRNKFLETSNKVLIEKLKGEIEDFKNKTKSLESSNNCFKEANNKLSEINNLLYTDFKKSQAELARRNSVEYASKYFEIQDLKSQLEDKGIVISELKKLIEKLKGKSVNTKFEKSSVIRQPNVFKSQRPSILGKPITFSNSLERNDFAKSKKTVDSESNQKPRNITRKLYEHVKKACSWWYPKFTPSGYTWKPKSGKENVNPNLVEIVLFIVDPGCSKHMTGNLKLLINFVEKFLGTVKYGNDQIAPILGYGDLVQGAVTIKRVYYVEGLNHNLFFVGQFCDADLEVAFRKSKCYIRDLKGNDLPHVLTLHAYFAAEGILHQMLVARIPEQNGIVKRRNRTLVEAARTMLSAAKVPLFFWAEATATSCFTQNRSLVIPRHDKTPYHIINDRKPSVKFFYIFGSLCYIVRDGENLDKMKEKGDACIFVGYFTQSRAYKVFNKRTRVIVETIHVNFDEMPQMASDHISSDPAPECQRMALEHDSLSPGPQSQQNVTQADKTITTSNELDLLFSLMFDELLNGSSKVVSKSSAESTADAPNQHQQHTTPLNTHTTPAPTCQVLTHVPTVVPTENMNQAEMVEEYAQVENNEFINIFCTPVKDRGETSSRHIDSSNMHTFYQHHPSEHRWTKDHPLEQVIGNPSQSVRTRHQLESNGEMYMFALTMSRTKAKNIKEAMAKSAWIESMQEELYQFNRLDV
nr:retrovirus-related Pol polyprotein from transposon TNT 1-94 [Tanacetum cinerariifolium]